MIASSSVKPLCCNLYSVLFVEFTDRCHWYSHEPPLNIELIPLPLPNCTSMSNLTISVPQAPGPAPSGILAVHGTDIVDVHGEKVVLKGAGLGGHLNMENCKSRGH